MQPMSNNEGHKLIKFRDYKNFDENEFLNDITESEGLKNILSETDVVRVWQSWKTEFLKHCNNHPPFVERRLKSRSNPWMTPNIVKSMYRRDFLHKKAVMSNDPFAWEQYKCLRNAVNSEVNTAKRNYYENVVTLNRNDPKSLWEKNQWPHQRKEITK